MRGRAIGFVVRATLPIGNRHTVRQAFPPRLVVGGDGDVGKNRVLVEHGQGIGIGRGAGAGRHAEVTRLGIDRIQAAVGAGAHPADVVADRPHFPAILAITFRRNQHGQVGLAAGARKCRGDIVRLALRVLDTDDQHVLGQPAFVARLPGSDAQRMALLAKQCITAVAGAETLDAQLFGEMHDEAPFGIQVADRMQALDEVSLALDACLRGGAHAGHDPHIDDYVRAVGDLDAAAGQR